MYSVKTRSYIFTKYFCLFYVFHFDIHLSIFYQMIGSHFLPSNNKTFLSCSMHRFYLGGSYMSIHWRGPNQSWAQTGHGQQHMEGLQLKQTFYSLYKWVFGDICPLNFYKEARAVLVSKWTLNTVMTLMNDFPMCLGLDDLYRQMRMCQDVAQLHWSLNPNVY